MSTENENVINTDSNNNQQGAVLLERTGQLVIMTLSIRRR